MALEDLVQERPMLEDCGRSFTGPQARNAGGGELRGPQDAAMLRFRTILAMLVGATRLQMSVYLPIKSGLRYLLVE